MSVIKGKSGHREFEGVRSAFDPQRTSASISYCSREADFSPYQSTRSSRYDADVLSMRAGNEAVGIYRSCWWSGDGLAAGRHRAQQPPIPTIGFLSAVSEGSVEHQAATFRRGLNEAGFVVGKNVAIEYRWADGQYDRLPAMAAELVRRPVSALQIQVLLAF